MLLNRQSLEYALENLNLSDEIVEQIERLLENIEVSETDIINLINTLPKGVLEQIQLILSPSTDQNKNRFHDTQTLLLNNKELSETQTVKKNSLSHDDIKLLASPTNIETLLELTIKNYTLERDTDSRMILKIIQNSPIFNSGSNQDDFSFEFRVLDSAENISTIKMPGSFNTEFITISGYQYGDGISTPNDIGRPNARQISNHLFSQTGDVFNKQELSNYLWVWGQFLDHDINLTREGHREAYDIIVPKGDIYFDPYSTGQNTSRFHRSGYKQDDENVDTPRVQINEITSFIDASNIYGSTLESSQALRTDGGKLLMGEHDFLPNTISSRGLEFLSGDVRTNENIALTSMHTIFAREHNYWVSKIGMENPEYSDELLYETAKAIVEAEMQAITYNEFLPLLIGKEALSEYKGHQITVNPQITTEFATAAFRVGHTMLSSHIMRLQESGQESIYGHLQLQDAFFRPDLILSQGGIDETMRGLGASYAQAIDSNIIDDVRNFLFGPPGAGGFDLVALNIQRGRDHGIPDYNTVREAYGLTPLRNFYELTDDIQIISELNTLYGDINRLDLWVGGLIEKTGMDALVGETFLTIIADQFARLRDGDKFWYENRFHSDDINNIKNTLLSDIILRNTSIEYLQRDIFTAHNRIGGDSIDNVLNGTNSSDLIIGFEGNDIINGNEGADTLYGGDGADTFVFDKIDGTIDTIRDFNSKEDKIDINGIIDNAYDALTNAIEDFLHMNQQEKDLVVSIDRDGTGNLFNFEKFMLIENTSVSEDIMIIIS